LNCQKHSLKRQSETKSHVKPTWSKKITVLSTFLESVLNFLSNIQKKNTTKLGTVREKSGSKFELPKNTEFVDYRLISSGKVKYLLYR